MSIRTRFAPSPTGWIHIGSLRTILFSYFWQKNEGGDFILRIEDTDQKREVRNGVKGIVETIDLFGIKLTEGYGIGGDYSPYIQSERLDIYKKYAKQLIEEGHAYYCFCSKERLEELRAQQKTAGIRTQYDGRCRNLSEEEISKKLNDGESSVIRLKVPRDEIIEYIDLVYGNIKFNTNEVEDQVLLKSDGFPTYHLAVVIDDYLMKITHIMRGEDWQSSTPKQILLYNAFGWVAPIFCHVPNVLNSDKKGKLSKRKGDVAVIDFLRKGYTVDALRNYLSLVGWNPDPKIAREDEFYTEEYLIEHFDPTRIKRSNGAFDPQKLAAMNNVWINHYSVQEFEENLLKWMSMVNTNYVVDDVRGITEKTELLREIVNKIDIYLKSITLEQKLELFIIIRPRINTFEDMWIWLSCVFESSYFVSEDFLVFKEKITDTEEVGKELIYRLCMLDYWDQEQWESTIRGFADEEQIKHGDMFMLLRFIVTGKKISLPLREFMVLIGKEKVQSNFELFQKQV